MAIKRMFQKEPPQPQRGASVRSSFTATGSTADIETEKGPFDDESKVPFLTIRTFFMAVLVSFGGLCFGYDTGQISGFRKLSSAPRTVPAKPECFVTEAAPSVLPLLVPAGCPGPGSNVYVVEMKNFLRNFADEKTPKLAFSNVRSGLIVGMVSGVRIASSISS